MNYLVVLLVVAAPHGTWRLALTAWTCHEPQLRLRLPLILAFVALGPLGHCGRYAPTDQKTAVGVGLARLCNLFPLRTYSGA